jgi:FkbH-like protein
VLSASIVEILRRRAADEPLTAAYSYLSDGSVESAILTWSHLDRRARATASLLQQYGAQGDRVLIACRQNLDWVVAFLGCLYAGSIAVPLQPPRRGGRSGFNSIAADAGAKFGIAEPADLAHIDCGTELRWLGAPIPDELAENWREHSPASGDVALLQYTSGSTSRPKGVEITHGNLVANQELTSQAFQQRRDSVILSWLPLFHDMGLCAGLLQPLYVGCRCFLMSPAAFLRDPLCWLRAISDRRVTTSGGPNFAYDLCVRRIAERDRSRLDLSCWTIAFNGAEPVRPDTVRAFSSAFRNSGFRSASFYPCYGLAEATLLVAARPSEPRPLTDRFDREALRQGRAERCSDGTGASELVGYQVVSELNVAVVNPATQSVCAASEVGEIWIAGPTVGRGYWGREKDTIATFGAVIAPTGEGPFLRTGDLGFFMDGALFPTGRMKDCLIFHGQNYDPSDIEESVTTALAGVGVGDCVAACVDTEYGEQLAIAIEWDRGFGNEERSRSAFAALRSCVATEYGLTVYSAAAVTYGGIPRTTSGKKKRFECRDRFLRQEWDAVSTVQWPRDSDARTGDAGSPPHEWATLDPARRARIIEEELIQWAARLANVPASAIDRRQTLISSGVDSLGAAELAAGIEGRWGYRVEQAEIMAGCSITDLSSAISNGVNERGGGSAQPEFSCGDDTQITGEQERLWWLQQMDRTNAALNLQIGWRLAGELDMEAFRDAVGQVVRRHDNLRSSFPMVSGRPARRVVAEMDVPIVFVNAKESDVAALAETQRLQPFDVESGPLVRLLLAALGEAQIVLLTAHHLICDASSLRIFLEDLAAAFEGKLTEADVPRPYSSFVESQHKLAAEPEIRRRVAYWRETLSALRSARPAARGGRGARLVRSAEVSDETAAGFRVLCQKQGITLFAGLLAAFKVALHWTTGARTVVVGCPVSGRPGPAFARTFGLFAYPIILASKIKETNTYAEQAREVARTAILGIANQLPLCDVLEYLPGNHLPYGAMFSYFGRYGPSLVSGIRAVPLPLAAGTDDAGLYAAVSESEGKWTLSFLSNQDEHSPAELDRLMSAYLRLLAVAPAEPNAALSVLASSCTTIPGGGRRKLVIAASFTADPLQTVAEFWIRELRLRYEAEVVSDQHVIQMLVDPGSRLRQNRDGVNVVLIRPEDLTGGDEARDEQTRESLLAALGAAAGHGSRLILGLCRASTRADIPDSAARWKDAFQMAAGQFRSIHLVDLERALALYGAADMDDAFLDRTAGIPYTMDWYAVAATATIRTLCAVEGGFGFKAIAVDLDNTLWRGVCSEAGPEGVAITEPCSELQRMLRDHADAGTLICVCSKNAWRDVEATFAANPAMPLTKGRIVAWRVGWGRKSESLRSLAGEFGIGLESFIFIDDDPVECAEVRANAPEVFTLEFPKDDAGAFRMLRHMWAFDIGRVTDAGLRRSQFVREEAARTELRRASMSLAAFLSSLDLCVAVSIATPAQADRISELTLRTNQFNMSRARYTEAQLTNAIASGLRCVVAHVRDRFGDYGLVGAVLYSVAGQTLKVEAFVLSCRALGRGVEHRIAATLGEIAAGAGATTVDFIYRPQPRNIPAIRFLESLSCEARWDSEGGTIFRFSADTLAKACYQPLDECPAARGDGDAPLATPAANPSSDALFRIAMHLTSPQEILYASRQRRGPVKALSYVAPRTADEQTLVRIVSELLGLERVGVTDDFFDLGGHSLLAARLIGRIFDEFGVEIPLRALFEGPATVEHAAELLDAERIRAANPELLAVAFAEIKGIALQEARALLGLEQSSPQQMRGGL